MNDSCLNNSVLIIDICIYILCSHQRLLLYFTYNLTAKGVKFYVNFENHNNYE